MKPIRKLLRKKQKIISHMCSEEGLDQTNLKEKKAE